ncbi:MAG: type IV pilus assembly protein PilM [Candidatus Moraniibacteriota bacterium]
MNFFKKNIINLEDKYFSIDLGSFSAKIVQLEKKSSGDFIRAYSSAIIPANCIEDGKIIDKQKIIQVIKAAVLATKPKKINTKKVICSLPESKVFLRVLSIPKMEKAEIGEAIKWEIEASIPLSIDQVYYDWQLIGESSGSQNVLTVAISREVVADILEVLEGAGLEVHSLEVESVAIARSLISDQSDSTEVALIVDACSRRTNFIIVEGNIPFFTSSVPFSSDGVTEAIAKTMGIGNEEAEKLKISSGINCFHGEGLLSNAISSYLEGLAIEIERTIDFYQNINNKSDKVKKIIICGGANLKGLVPYLTKRLKNKILIGDPWINLNFGQRLPIIDKEKSLQFATAIGLAMRKKI